MLPEDEQLFETEPVGGLIDREYERVSASLGESQCAVEAIHYPIINFFGGSVSTDRQRHENAAQSGGLAHWRHNTSKQRVEDNRVPFTNAGSKTQYHLQVPRPATVSGGSVHSTGMGLEEENLLSFITTGSHYKIVPMAAPTPPKNGPAPQQAPVSPQAASPPSSPVKSSSFFSPEAAATGTIYSYRRKKSVTFTNLLKWASNQ